VIAFIVGLRQEARLLRGLSSFVGGGLPEGAASATRQAIAAGATAIVSFGVAGGLDPRLRAGAIIRPGAVLWQGRLFPADPALTRALGGQTGALIATETTPAATARQKKALREATGAAAIDLESGPAAELAARHHLPFAALRAICDTAVQDLPQAALIALDPGGRILLGRVIASLLQRPGQLPGLVALGRDAARARRALAREIALLRGQETLSNFG
jgi:adenosylhomocysteine nucleosidase